MKLFTMNIRKKLLQNGQLQAEAASADKSLDHIPVVKLFTPDANATWLLTELDPNDPHLAFGLCDVGLGFPELGYVSIDELALVRGQLGLPIERDKHFTGQFPLSTYAKIARMKGHIITCARRIEDSIGD